jgi:hypothetical protein
MESIVADDEQATPRRGRRLRAEDRRPEQDAPPQADEQGQRDEGQRKGTAIPAAQAARRAAQHVADFTGRDPESVISIERRDGHWRVGVEVVETHRIPDTMDVLAIYDVRLEGGGGLVSYCRTRRYTRGQLDKECR